MFAEIFPEKNVRQNGERRQVHEKHNQSIPPVFSCHHFWNQTHRLAQCRCVFLLIDPRFNAHFQKIRNKTRTFNCPKQLRHQENISDAYKKDGGYHQPNNWIGLSEVVRLSQYKCELRTEERNEKQRFV